MPPMCRSGRLDLRRHRLALLLTPNPCSTKRILILTPEPIVPCAPERPFHVGAQLPTGDLSNLRARDERAVSLTEPLLGPGPTQGGRFACEVGPGRVHDRQSVAAPDQPKDRTDVGTIAACIDRMPCDFVKCRSPAAFPKPPP